MQLQEARQLADLLRVPLAEIIRRAGVQVRPEDLTLEN